MRKMGRWIVAGLLTSLVVMSCGEETGPIEPILMHFNVAPSFSSESAGILTLTAGRFTVFKLSDADEPAIIASDTVIAFASGDSAVSFELSVVVVDPSDEFVLNAALVDAVGDTVFRAGPIAVDPNGSDLAAAPLPLVFDYVGIGSNAVSVRIVGQSMPIYSGDTIIFTAEALDNSGNPIAGTPVAWSSLDPNIASVPMDSAGIVVGGNQGGTARIVARLLTHQEDTVGVIVKLPASGLQVQSGNNQIAPINSALGQPIVARVTAADGSGVDSVLVIFAVTTGGGTLSVDSVLTDANGDAASVWTLGATVGSQMAQATTPALPGMTAGFAATGTSTGASGIAISVGNNQIGMIGVPLPVAPTVVVTVAGGGPSVGATVVFVITSGAGSVTGDTAVTDSSGVASVGSWTLGTVGVVQTLQANVTGLNPVTFGATSTNIDGAVSIMITAGNGQIRVVDSAVAIAPSVTLTGPGGAPVAGASVTFAIAGGAGAVTGANAVTDSVGVAAVGSWTLGQSIGANSLTATAPDIAPVTFAASGIAQAAQKLVVVSGNTQADTTGLPLALPIVAEAQDQFDNPVNAVNVSWFPTDGSVNPTSGFTNATGQVTTTWTLGANEVNPTLTAQSPGLQSVVFSATTIFPNPTILMGLVGANRIRVGDSADLQVTLTAPAGAGGVLVNVTSDVPANITVGTPDTVAILQGATTGTIKLHALSSGTTTIRATAPGYANGAQSVLASVQVLSLPATLNVPFGGTASMPITLSTAAGAGGEIVNLTTTIPGNVGLISSTVTVPAGQTTVNGTVSGLAPGQSVITASSVNFGSAQSTVSATANLNIVQNSLTVNANFPGIVTIRLESGGSQIAAPAPGITVAMLPRDLSCVAAVNPVVIPTGLVDTVSTMSYGGSAQLPCSSWVIASSPGIATDSVNVSVNPPPQINLSSFTDVGSGLTRAQSISMGQGVPMITPVRFEVSDSSLALVAGNVTDVGTGFIDYMVPQNVLGFTYYIHGLEGMTGPVTVVASALGYIPDTTVINVVAPAVDIISLTTATTSFSNDDPFRFRVGVPNVGLTAIILQQALRPGSPGFVGTLVSSDTSVARLTTTATSGDSVSVGLVAGVAVSPSSVALGGVAFDPVSAGTTLVSVTVPGFVSVTNSVRSVVVSAPALTLTVPTVTGSGLQRIQFGSLGAPAPAGTIVRLVSSDSSIMLLAPNNSTLGAGTVDILMATGLQSFSYYTQGLEGVTDTVTITASAPGYTGMVQNAWSVTPAFEVSGLAPATTSLSNADAFYVRTGIPSGGNGFLIFIQALRVGSPGVTATLVTSDPAVGILVTTVDTAQTVFTSIVAGQSRSPTTVALGGVALRPLAAGATTVSATIPGYIGVMTATRIVAVTAPRITLNPAVVVGSGLQRRQFGSVSAPVPDTTVITLQSADSTILLLAPDNLTVGTGTLNLTLNPGAPSISYYTHGLEGAVDTIDVFASSPGYTPDTTAVAVLQPAVDLIGLPTTITTLTANDAFQARIGVPNAGLTGMQVYESLRPGAPIVTVTVTNSQSGVAQLVTTPLSGQSVMADILSNNFFTPSGAATGGFDFEPLATGSTTVQVSIPGYVTLPTGARVVNVTSPAINLTPTANVGSGLMNIAGGSLSAPAPAGTILRLKSSNPGVALVSANNTTAGTDSVDIALSTGGGSFPFYVHGIEAQTGTVTITATAAGYTDGTIGVTIVQPALVISGLSGSTTTLSANDGFQIALGVPNATNTGMQRFELVRAGATPPVFTLTNSNALVGELLSPADTGQSVTVSVAAGQGSSPIGVANGGPEFRPLGTGSTNVSATGTGYISLPTATRAVSVTTPNITFATLVEVGSGLQESHTISLGAPAPAGFTVRITSLNPSVMMLQADASTAATTFIDVAFTTGGTSAIFYSAGLEGQIGTSMLTAAGTGFNPDTSSISIVAPGLEIVSLGLSKVATSTDDPFTVRVGPVNAGITGLIRIQEIRAGATALSVAITNSDAAVGELVQTAGSAQSATVQIVAGVSTSPSSVGAGGMSFRVLGVGSSTVDATATGFLQVPNATRIVTVN